MDKNKYIVADLGSSRISVLATEILNTGEVRVLSAESKRWTDQIRYGVIKNPAKVAYTITELVKLLQNSARIREIKNVCVSLNAKTMKNVSLNVTKNIEKNRIITEQQLDDLADDCVRKVDGKTGLEVFDVIPLSYKVDGEETDNPIGMSGRSISALYNLIVGNSAIEEELERCFERTRHLSPEEYFPLGMEALATVLLEENEKENGCALINLGATTTTITAYKNGALQKMLVVPLGAHHITKDIAELGMSYENAERLKCLKGSALNALVENPVRVSIPSQNEGEGALFVDTDFLATIIEARLSEIMSPIFQAISELSFELEEGIILCGGGSKLRNIIEFFNEKIDLPVHYGSHSDWLSEDTRDEFFDPIYAQSIGTIVLLDEYYKKENRSNKKQQQKEEKARGANGKKKFSEKVAGKILDLFNDKTYLD